MKKPIYKNRILRIVSLAIIISVVTLAGKSFIDNEQLREKEEEGAEEILGAMDLWSEMRTYPNKQMNASGFSKAFEQGKHMSYEERMSKLGMFGVTTAPWSNLAPMNFAGRILCLGFHPTDANIMWVGSAGGGLWKTTNGGTGAVNGINWTYVPTGFPTLAISSIAINPSNANTIYVGTGEVYNTGALAGGATGAGHIRLFRGSYGIGILKTTDGGATWTKSLDFSNSNIKGVSDLLIDPANPSIVYAATTDGLYRTINAGTSWQLISGVGAVAIDLIYKPGSSTILYVGCGDFGTVGAGIYKTTNANAATPTFTKLTTGLPTTISGKIQLAISPNNTSKIYASIGANPDNTADPEGLWVSTNEGVNWSQPGATNIIGTQGWYAHDIVADPTNANIVYWGELDMYKSTNGGASAFTKISTWSGWDINNTLVGDIDEGTANYVHADVHRLHFSPHSNTTLFLCTDGGLFRSTNGGTSFQTLNGGLATAQIYANIAVHPTNPNYVLCGLQDNEAMVYEGNQGCRRIGNLGDGFHSTMNSTGTIQIVESYYFNRRRSTNSGGIWGAGSGAVPTTEVACFNVPMVYSKTASSTRVFAGTVLFKRSTDNGATWANLNGGSPIAGANNPAIAMYAANDNVVYFSTAPGGGVRSKLWKTTNASAATPTFTEITGTLPDRYYSDIFVDPADVNRVIVTLSGFGSSHVYMSANGGTSWSNLGTGLPDVPHNTVMFQPTDRSTVYIGNDQGVYYANAVPTGALGAATSLTWTAYNEGLGDAVQVSDLEVTNTNKFRMATYGRGLWERDFAPSSPLPVVLKQFDVITNDRGNDLKWVIASQTNTDRYEVEYSTDASQFTKIAIVNTKFGNGEINYNYLHEITNNVNGYYRIKIVDNDDTYTYSEVEEVKAQKASQKLILFPNPTTGIFNIKIPAQNEGVMNVKVYDNSGRLITLKKINIAAGQQEATIDISSIPTGNYQVICENNKARWITKLLKK